MARNYRLPKNYKEDDIKYSVRDLSLPKATTLMQCLNIPIYGEELLSHDKFRVKLASLLQSNALQTPLFGRYKLRISTFNCPMTNYYGFMDNNTKLSADDWDNMPKWTVSPALGGLLPLGNYYDISVGSDIPSVWDYLPLGYLKLKQAFGAYLTFAGVIPRWNGYVYSGVSGLLGDTPVNVNNEEDYPVWRAFAVQPGSLLDYMGITPGYIYHDGTSDVWTDNSTGRTYLNAKNEWYDNGQGSDISYSKVAHFIIAYLDAVRTYLVNKQLAYAVYTVNSRPVGQGQTFSVKGVGTSSSDLTSAFEGMGQIAVSIPLSALDEFFLWLRRQENPGDLYVMLQQEFFNHIKDYSTSSAAGYDRTFWASHILIWMSMLRFGGLFTCMYESDMLQNLLTDVEGAESFVSVLNGQFSIDSFRLANRKQRRRERVAISGGRYKDILRVLWNAKSRSSVDIPDFIDTRSFMIDPRNIISTSDTDVPDASTGKSLGQMAGNVNEFKSSNRGFTVRTEDPSQLMMIVSLVPEIMYSDGFDKNLLSLRFADDYTPQFDQVGFQDVPGVLYNCLANIDDQGRLQYNSFVRTVGKNVAWNRYLSNVGRVHGHFVRGFDYDSYVLTRDYSGIVREEAPSANVFNIENQPNGYALPMDYQYPFIIQESTFPNWFFQLDLDIRATRAIGKNYMPTLGK